MFRRNRSQVVSFAMVTTAGAADAAAAVNAKTILDGVLASAVGNIVNKAGGAYSLFMASADCDATIVSLFLTATGDVPVMITFPTTAANPQDTARFGLLNLSSAAPGTQAGLFICGSNAGATTIGSLVMGSSIAIGNAFVIGGVNDIPQTGDSFARIGVAGAGLTNIDLPNQTMDITGNLSGSVGSVTGAVGSVTGAVGSVTGAVGSVTGNVGGNVLGSVQQNIGGYVNLISATAQNAIADATLDRTAGIETGFTLRQAQRLILSAAAAKLSGAAGPTIIIRDVNDTKNRITASVDATGRTAVTVDAT